MSSSFLLLHLPYVAIKHVLDQFNTQLLLFFSMSSQKMKNFIKSTKFYSKDGLLELSVGSWFEVISIREQKKHVQEKYKIPTFLIRIFELSDLPNDRILILGRIGRFLVRMEVSEHGWLNTYWENRLIGIQEVTKLVMETFDKQIDQLDVGTKKSTDDPKWSIDYINSFQDSLPGCFITEESELDDGQIEFIFKNCKVTKRFYLTSKPADSFRFPEPLPFNNLNILSVRFSKWITFNHLLSFNCKWIALRNSILTCQEIHLFLMHWLNGGCPQLKEIRINTNTLMDHDVVFAGVDVEISRTARGKRYVNKDGLGIPVNGTFRIQNGDITASVLRHPLAGQNEFFMIVWPDWAGNML